MNNFAFDTKLFLQWTTDQIYNHPQTVPALLELMKLANNNDSPVLDIAEAFETYLMTAAAQELEGTSVWDFVNNLFCISIKEAQEFLKTAEGYEARNFAHSGTPQALRFQAILTWKEMGDFKSRDPSWYNPTCYIVSAKDLARSWRGVGERWGNAFQTECEKVLNQRTGNE